MNAPIPDVVVQPLRKIPDERGCILHMLRSDDPLFERFGEIVRRDPFSDTIPYGCGLKHG